MIRCKNRNEEKVECGSFAAEGSRFCPMCGGSLVGDENAEKIQPGSSIFLGTWDGEPIEWIVLEMWENERKALVLSRYGLERKEYNEKKTPVTWEYCSLRQYMQTELIRKIFNPEEKQRVLPVKNRNQDHPKYGTSGGNETWDGLFLLSIQEYKKYFEEEGSATYEYRTCRGNKESDGTRPEVWWWLRSPGYSDDYAADVYIVGALSDYGYGVGTASGCVRPAFYLNLSS